MEEVASLLEPSEKDGGLYIDPIFSNTISRNGFGQVMDMVRRVRGAYTSAVVSYSGSTSPANSLFVQFSPWNETLGDLVI